MDLRGLDKLVLGKEPVGGGTVKPGQSSAPFTRGVLDGTAHLEVCGRERGRTINAEFKQLMLRNRTWKLHPP